MRIALAQLNARVGDLPGNARRIADAAEFAVESGATHLLAPELVLPGAPPRDLLFDDRFVADTVAATHALAESMPPGLTALVGTVVRAPARTPGHPGLFNTLAVLRGGRVAGYVSKRLLPSYDVFHETRWFVPGEASEPIDGLGALVCEDLWDDGYPVHPGAELRAAGATVLACAAASPFRDGIFARRAFHAGRQGFPVVYVNLVGGQDELVFDGGSFVTGASGAVVRRLPFFDEAVEIVDTGDLAGSPAAMPADDALTFDALVLGVRDFARKNGVRRAVLGLSGGIDSALVACIAREALGGANVTGVAMPTRFNDPRSTACARELAANLGIGFDVVEFDALAASVGASIDAMAGNSEAMRDGDTTAENVQARLRAMVLLARINRSGGLLLNTSNKTELTLGYGTLHGDLAGTLSVIGDLVKPRVYDLARGYDAGRGVIPRFILERPPSAELRENQVDPFDYPVIAPRADAVFGRTPDGDDAAMARTIRTAEHKRWQGGIVLKVTDHAIGTGRMMPVTRTR